MPFLTLGKEIKLDKTDCAKASVCFSIENAEAVDRFLQDKELISFLTDPYSGENAKSGCRLTITRVDNKLTIARQLGHSTIIPAAAWICLPV